MKMRILLLTFLLLVLAMVAAACAIADTPVEPGPPVTLSPPPTLALPEISCDVTSALESWLQSSTFIKEDFLEIMKTAAGKRGDIHDDVLTLAALLNQASTISVPDCAADAHVIIVDAMDRAVKVFQEYNNGDREELGDIVSDTKGKFDEAGIIQVELTDRLEQQYKNQ